MQPRRRFSSTALRCVVSANTPIPVYLRVRNLKDRATHRLANRAILYRHRPHYSPAARFEILELRNLLGWNQHRAAIQFLVSDNTISNWERDQSPESKTVGSLAKPIPPVTRLNDATRRFAPDARRRSCIERCTFRAGPEAQPNVPKNGRNRALQLRVNPKVPNDNPCDFDAQPLGHTCQNRRTIAAEQELLGSTDVPREREDRSIPEPTAASGLGAGVAGLCGGREHERPFRRPKVACALSSRLHAGTRQGPAFLV
jgi:DNA-binding transcriptional regulator YiaG